MYDIIDTAASTNVGTLNLASANLTTEDFDPYEQRHTVHTRNYKGYRVVATCANSKHQGGVAVLWRVSNPDKPKWKPNFDVESIQKHGPNCMSYLYVIGDTKWPVIVAYLLPETLEDLPYLQAAFD